MIRKFLHKVVDEVTLASPYDAERRQKSLLLIHALAATSRLQRYYFRYGKLLEGGGTETPVDGEMPMRTGFLGNAHLVLVSGRGASYFPENTRDVYRLN